MNRVANRSSMILLAGFLLIVGTGDQVGRETPEENLLAMIEEGKCK